MLYYGFTLVGNATRVVANVHTCNTPPQKPFLRPAGSRRWGIAEHAACRVPHHTCPRSQNEDTDDERFCTVHALQNPT